MSNGQGTKETKVKSEIITFKDASGQDVQIPLASIAASIQTGNINQLEDVVKKGRKKLREQAETTIITAMTNACDNDYCTPMEFLNIVKDMILPSENSMISLRELCPDGITINGEEKWTPRGTNARLPEILRSKIKKIEDKKDDTPLLKAIQQIDSMLKDMIKDEGIDIVVEGSSMDNIGEYGSDSAAKKIIDRMNQKKAKIDRTRKVGAAVMDGKKVGLNIEDN